ncbi:Tetratricopeptide repeat-containing protein [Robiginitalea myxolifaciens]|uniref:Tetratricopeptide repeat-containing protein n=1 Tax=Robiginitalea myxolifaciens TaxID=400055 RepID=A0A1I6FNL5_9FLAO|nr:tetratricopeptide repeat protein [Robiginitalea myxolifaciens]SFR31498.1 Tetratricopeptide repeat-containing protein [Robiginitalea myxolifaciens]
MALDPNEQPGPPIAKFESMLKTDDVYFFDAEDFEEIIHHYLNNGRISLAKKAIRMGLQQHPDALELRLLEVEVLVFENHLDQAQLILDQLQQINSRNQEICIQQANICSKKDQHDLAIDWLKRALELEPDDPDVHSLLGMEYLFLDAYSEAQQCFMRCVAEDPEDYASLYNVVYCFEFREDFRGGIRFLNAYLETNPYCQVAWHQLGKLYKELDMLKEALGAFEFAVISDDSFIGAYFEKGRVLEKLGRLEEAIENYQATMDLDDPTSHAYLRMGRCFEKLGDDEQAQAYYYRTVHDDPLLDKGWLAITEFYLRRELYEKALEFVNKAIHIDGENADYWARCGKIHLATGNLDEADYAYSQAVRLEDYSLGTWSSWCEVLWQAKEYQALYEVLKQAIKFHPKTGEFRYRLAGISFLLGKEKKARTQLKHAINMLPEAYPQFQEDFPEFPHWVPIEKASDQPGKASE